MTPTDKPAISDFPDSAAADAAVLASLTDRWGRSWVEIDSDALRRNFRRVVAAASTAHPRCVIACVKKEGYGHGLETVARALAAEPALWGFGVATVEEALALRLPSAPPIPRDCPVLLLVPVEGPALEAAIRHNVALTVTDLDEARRADAAAAALGMRPAVHFKFDSGMGRLGRLPAEVRDQLAAVAALPHLKLEAIFTHLADGWGDPASRARQAAAVEGFRAATDLPCHWGGSDALALAHSMPPADYLRVGIALYGDHPAADFEPAMTFKTRIVYRRHLPAGTPVSYGSTHITPRPTEAAVIGAGYGNGLMRALSGRGAVLIGGARCPILGRVCMDQTVVDVTDLLAGGGRSAVGDEAVIFGIQRRADGSAAILPAAEPARLAGTISYELFCLAGQLNPRRIVESGG